jgi:hypothetical protein
MVEVSPLPADFPPATNPDIPVRRELPGGGYSDISRGAMARFEAEQAWLRRPIVHPAEVARQQEAAAAAQEAAARALPDPRIALRDRHAEHAAAAAEALRADGRARQADELVADLQRRHAEAEAAIEAGDREAAERLAEAIAAGMERDGWPLAPRVDPAQSRATELAIKVHVATQARDRFTNELKAAKAHEARARRELELAALQTLVNVAADIAGDIHQVEAALERRRAGLMTLRSLLDREQRRLGRYQQLTVTGPPVLAMPEAVDPTTDWRSMFEQLIADPETALE